MYVATLVLLCLLAVSQTIAVNPGVKMRITKKGFDYANTVARQVIAAELNRLTFADQSGSSGHISWELKNIKIKSVDPPGSNLGLDPANNGLSLSLSDFGIKISTDWRVKYKKGWIKASTHGSADVGASGLGLVVTTAFGVDGTGRPTITAKDCHEHIGSVSVKFHGGLSWLYNMFKGTAAKQLKKALSGQICKVVDKTVKDDATKALKKMIVTQELDQKFILNYGLVAPPVINANYLETQHKGQIFWKANKKGVNFTPAPIPASSATSNMLYIWLSDFVAKSIAQVAQSNKYLQHSITKQDLPTAQRQYLDTTCNAGSGCAGDVVPQIGQQHPNSELEVRVRSTAAPTVTFHTDSIGIALHGATELVIHKPNKSLVNLLTLHTNMSLSMKVKVEHEKLMGEITKHNFKVGLDSGVAGKFSTNGLNSLVEKLSTQVLIPSFNRLAKNGILLPVTEDIKFKNTNLKLLNGAIMVGTDVTYTYTP